jgi:hypothetical protein
MNVRAARLPAAPPSRYTEMIADAQERLAHLPPQ